MEQFIVVQTPVRRAVAAATLLSAALLAHPSAVMAQSPDDLNAKIAALEASVKSAQSAGDNAWMLVSSALVLMMTGPGLALFYGGLVRRKNVLATMMHSFILMAVVTVIWAVVGYSLAFGGSSPFIGNFQFAWLDGVGSAPNTDYAGTIPQATFMVYQLMFAIITPALISGAFAERMKFSAMLVFTVLWALIVYFPMAHMVWGKGGLLNAFSGGTDPYLRFCGRNGGAYHERSLGAGLRVVPGQAPGTSDVRHEAAQPGDQLHGSMPALGGLVRIQRRKRAGRQRTGHERLRGYALRRRGRDAVLAGRGMGVRGQAQHAGRHFGLRGGTGGDYARVRIRQAVPRDGDRRRGGTGLLFHGHAHQAEVRLRRCAGCIRRPRRGRHGGSHPHGRLRHQCC